jgi:uncharacterized membrane protein
VNPLIVVAAAAVAWLAGMFIAWALVHGAQILRREEAAQMASEAVEREELATIQPIAPETDRLPAAA